MKDKLIEILKSDITPSEMLKQIKALAPDPKGPFESESEKLYARVAAFQEVLMVLDKCPPEEVTVSPRLCYLLAMHFKNLGESFTRQETVEISRGEKSS